MEGGCGSIQKQPRTSHDRANAVVQILPFAPIGAPVHPIGGDVRVQVGIRLLVVGGGS